MAREKICHSVPCLCDEHSKILILGTMLSSKSREEGFYYANPHNRFWKVMAELFSEPLPESIEEKKMLMLKHKIALWDVLESCSIIGADDQSIRDVKINDVSKILEKGKVEAIFTTGKKAFNLYQKHLLPQTRIEAISLPSTSPANCRYFTYSDIVKEYRKILPYLL